MSRKLIAHNADLQRLENEGYDLEFRSSGSLLLIRDVPYVDASREVKRGTLVLRLTLAGDVALKPTDHTARWIGAHPCHADGRKIGTIANSSTAEDMGDGVRIEHVFSAKADYRDYHHQATTYIGRIAGEAAMVDPAADPKTFPAIPQTEKEGVHKYADTASTRAGIAALNNRLDGEIVGIIGVGGSGSYVLDLAAKTSSAEIHIFDKDIFQNHSAFRAPGAASIETLRQKLPKVDYFGGIYDDMRRGIVRHPVFIDASKLDLLDCLTFAFLCMDRGEQKRAIVEHLVRRGLPFIDVGMGLSLTDDKLTGLVRVVLSTPKTRERAAPHISYAEGDAVANEYASNIQSVELNALNAALAVIRWKQYRGIYHDLRAASYLGYSIASGTLTDDNTP